MDGKGSGSAHFRVASSIAATNCAGYCAIAATDGKSVQSTPISFAAKGRVDIATGFGADLVSIYVNGTFFYATQNERGLPPFDAVSGNYRFDFYQGDVVPGSKTVASTSVDVKSGQATSLVVYQPTGSKYALIQTSEPPPAPAGKLRIRIVNPTPVSVTAKVDNLTVPALAPGVTTTILMTPPANVPIGSDSVTLSYPSQPPATAPCPGFEGGGFERGHGYVVTVLYAHQGPTTCPYLIGPIIQGGAF